jgi:ABC-type branched-subunit amino acid transport system ATPase component
MTAAIGTAVLSAGGVRSGYGAGGDIVRGIDLDIGPKTILAVIGPNGSGKSTFLKTLAGVLRTRAGYIRLGQQVIGELSPAKRVVAGLGYVPQEANVFRALTIGENIKLATEFLGKKKDFDATHVKRVMELFPEISTRLSTLAGSLSGGQRQMLAFACALLAQPRVLLLDEPSAGLSPKFVGMTMDAISRTRDLGVSVVLVEQNVSAALRVADEVLVLVAGRRRLLVPAGEISTDKLAELYFGKDHSE